jgi:hypothetical protein
MRRTASFFTQTLRSYGWVLIKAIYLIDGLLLHNATPFDWRMAGSAPARKTLFDQWQLCSATTPGLY